MLSPRGGILEALALSSALACASCGSPADGSAASSSVSAPSAPASAAPSTSKPASSWGAFPKAARRDSSPEGIAARAVAEGALAPAFSLSGPRGAWSLTDGLSKSDYVVLVFYRGAW